jgi:hypothetical protein
MMRWCWIDCSFGDEMQRKKEVGDLTKRWVKWRMQPNLG